MSDRRNKKRERGKRRIEGEKEGERVEKNTVKICETSLPVNQNPDGHHSTQSSRIQLETSGHPHRSLPTFRWSCSSGEPDHPLWGDERWSLTEAQICQKQPREGPPDSHGMSQTKTKEKLRASSRKLLRGPVIKFFSFHSDCWRASQKLCELRTIPCLHQEVVSRESSAPTGLRCPFDPPILWEQTPSSCGANSVWCRQAVSPTSHLACEGRSLFKSLEKGKSLKLKYWNILKCSFAAQIDNFEIPSLQDLNFCANPTQQALHKSNTGAGTIIVEVDDLSDCPSLVAHAIADTHVFSTLLCSESLGWTESEGVYMEVMNKWNNPLTLLCSNLHGTHTSHYITIHGKLDCNSMPNILGFWNWSFCTLLAGLPLSVRSWG